MERRATASENAAMAQQSAHDPRPGTGAPLDTPRGDGADGATAGSGGATARLRLADPALEPVGGDAPAPGPLQARACRIIG